MQCKGKKRKSYMKNNREKKKKKKIEYLIYIFLFEVVLT